MVKHPSDVAAGGTREVPLRDKVAFLCRPKAYSGKAGEVSVRETHMAWVFLIEDRVYKLKKPVEYSYRDCHFLEDREFLCREEVRLNRRLAEDVYLGVEALGLDADGHLTLGGETVVDWLVVMRRLPEHRLLDTALAEGTVTREDVARVGDRLAAFYRNREPVTMSVERYLDHFEHQHRTNREVLTDTRFSLPRERVETVLGRMERLFDEEPELLGERARGGHIVEGHGDLRPEHVCLEEPPVIIDCLEFSRPLRLVDPFDELCFLGMECERLGGGWIGPQLVQQCREALGDAPEARLLAFYTAYRACLRARLALSHLYEPDGREREKWEPRARDYLALAERACRRLDVSAP